MKFATIVSLLLMLVALSACARGATIPAGQYTFSVVLPAEITFGEITPTLEVLPTWTVPTQTPPRTVTNTSGSAYNIRLEPSTSGAFLELFAPGETLELDGVMGNGWLRIERRLGGTGFVHPDCCKDHG